MRFFNTAGPVNCNDHYCLPPLSRFKLDEVLSLIDQKKYFVLHAPRQTGKTSSLLALMNYLNSTGKFTSLYINVETAQTAYDDVYRGMKAILSELMDNAKYYLKDNSLQDICFTMLEQRGGDEVLKAVLSEWSMKSDRPLVLLVDEIDALIGDTLISVLRQLRSGYNKRPEMFPQSIILCGIRDVRDYSIHSCKDNAIIFGRSAYDVKAVSLRMEDFSRLDVEALYQQHTDETGQRFLPEAIEFVWEFTDGQPWLVNALGYDVCFQMKENHDRSVSITADMVRQAGENLIIRRETHIDQLIDKLKEERVQRVIEPMLVGDNKPEQASEDDILYVRDLGLIKIDGSLRIANRICQEVIPRALTYATQVMLSHEPLWYVRQHDGSLDMEKLLTDFQDFFRKYSENWSKGFQYNEAAAQLLMQAFLARIVNSGGQIYREYGLGRQRTDLLLIWPFDNARQEVVIELKIRYDSTEKTIEKALKQTWAYMDKCGTQEGHLVIFDKRENVSWEVKIFHRMHEYEGHKIVVWGM